MKTAFVSGLTILAAATALLTASVASADTSCKPRLIEKQTSFPLGSQIRGQEGTVYMNIVIDENGRAQRADLQRSSGYRKLDRAAARHTLDLDPHEPAVLVLLGAGNNYDYEPVRKVVLARLGKAPNVQIVAAEWLIADLPVELPEHVRRLAEYPISRYLAAFDFAISAVGYNSFHELLFAAVPTRKNPTRPSSR